MCVLTPPASCGQMRIALVLETHASLEMETMQSCHRTGHLLSLGSGALARAVIVMSSSHTHRTIHRQSGISSRPLQSTFQFPLLSMQSRGNYPSILLCTLNRPLCASTDTNRNPADAGSREPQATRKSSAGQKSLQARRQRGTQRQVRVQTGTRQPRRGDNFLHVAAEHGAVSFSRQGVP